MPLYRESFIFFLDTETPAILWTGHGDLPLVADAVLPADVVALGGGDLINLPELEQLINGTAQRIEVVVSGVSETAIGLAREEAGDVLGAQAYIGRVRFDDDWQQDGPVVWEWTGEGRGLSCAGEDSADGRTRTITLKLASGETTRSRAPFSFFTDADQRRDFPDDGFFGYVGAINSGTSRRWGPQA